MWVRLRSVQITGFVLLACLPPSYGQKGPGAKGDLSMFGSHLVTDEVVKDNPYSAEGISEITQTLSDGKKRSRKFITHLYRSGDGRVRLEENIISDRGIWADSANELRRISVFDPSTRSGFILDPQDMLVEHYNAGKSLEIPLNPASASTQSLDPEVLDGLTIQGTRRTKVIPAGDSGNTLPIEIVDERWYSPDLRVVVMTKHSDPRMGNVIYQLTQIDRSEPPAGLFEVPPGYRGVGTKPKGKDKK